MKAKTATFLYLLALFLLVTGARFWLIGRFAVALPFWDQWDVEGWELLRPWLQGHLTWSDWLAAHNEHRLLLTRLLTFGTWQGCGRWSPLWEMRENALLCGALASAMAAVLLRLFHGRHRRIIFVSVCVCLVNPAAWENTIWGFESQCYLLNSLSLAAIWGFGFHEIRSAKWWFGLVAAVLACGAMGSGFVAAGCATAMIIFRAWQTRTWDRNATATASVGMIIVIVSLLTRSPSPDTANLRVSSGPQLLWAFAHYFSWPLGNYPWMALWMIAPLLLLTVGVFRRTQNGPRAELLLMAGAWWTLQVLAAACFRGGDGALPPSRYKDLFVLGAFTGFFAVLTILDERPSFWKRSLLALWSVPVIWGFATETRTALTVELPERSAFLHLGQSNVVGYLRSGDAARFLINQPHLHLPYPNAARLQMMLDDPVIRKLVEANLEDTHRVESTWQLGQIMVLAGGLVVLTQARFRRGD